MRVDVLTREYPPEVYGGAGVHVTELVRALRAGSSVAAAGSSVVAAGSSVAAAGSSVAAAGSSVVEPVETLVRAFGAPREEPGTFSYPDLPELAGANPALRTLGVDLTIAEDCAGADLVHSHTWYANFAGHVASLLHGIPHVITAHSLEPLRPWKAEQLGGGYALSSWAERTAYESAAAVIGVSSAMRADILRAYPAVDPAKVHVVHNGIDTEDWAPRHDPETVRRLGVDPDRRTVIFVGRITRQKGLPWFLRACAGLDPDVQIVLCAGAPDTPEIAAEVTGLVEGLQSTRQGVVWIPDMLPRADLTALLTQATVFACPSVYEPLGIVNLEAMACETAVVATATGGIPEVVLPGETGLLVPIEQAADGTGTPLDPERFVADTTAALSEVLADPARAEAMGRAGRRRAIEAFSWDAIATRTLEVYRQACEPV